MIRAKKFRKITVWVRFESNAVFDLSNFCCSNFNKGDVKRFVEKN